MVYADLQKKLKLQQQILVHLSTMQLSVLHLSYTVSLELVKS